MIEDQAETAAITGRKTLASAARMAPNLIANVKSKISKRRKLTRAGWSNAFRAKLVARF
ncbi:MAG: hypothetical protein ACR2KT_14025 [Methylocella sp.]